MTDGPIIVFVPGIPKTAGSKRAFVITPKAGGKPRAIVTDDCKGGRDWKHDVQRFVSERFPAPLGGPIFLSLTFVLPRPKGHFKKSGQLRPGSASYPSTRPDVLKLARAV